MRPSERAWLGLGAGIAVYEVLCPRGETLSECVDAALEGSPLTRAVTLGAIGVTALHLANLLPPKYDPFSHALKWKDR